MLSLKPIGQVRKMQYINDSDDHFLNDAIIHIIFVLKSYNSKI